MSTWYYMSRTSEGGERVVSDCENRKRWKKLTLRYTQEEYNVIVGAAEAAGETASNYVLRAVIALQEQEQQAQDNQQAIE